MSYYTMTTAITRILVGLLLLIMALAISSCDNTTTGKTSTPASAQTNFEITSQGNGPITQQGSVIVMTYSGFLPDGKEFDSTKSAPFCFQLGSRKVIEGLEERLIGVKQGTKLKFTVPPEKAYGETGFGNLIPPNTPLTYEVELLSVLPEILLKSIPPDLPKPVEKKFVTEGVSYLDLTSGSGEEVEPGKTASLHYTCWEKTGKRIRYTVEVMPDVQSDRCQPREVLISQEDKVNILDEVLQGMKVGGQRLVIIEEETEKVEDLKDELLCGSDNLGSILLFLSKVY